MNEEINIRLAKSEEIESIIDLQTLALLNPHSKSRQYDRYQVESLVKGQADMRRDSIGVETILLAEDRHRQLLGFACLCMYRPEIYGLYVHPDFMRRGIGSQLLNAIEKIAIERKVKVLNVLSSIEAVDFYRKNGYTSQYQTGFSKALVWIPCQRLKKQLIPYTLSDRLLKELIIIITVVILIIIMRRVFR